MVPAKAGHSAAVWALQISLLESAKEMTFYTYLWLREDGTPYYAGKGKGQRAFYKHGRNGRGRWIKPPADMERIILQEWPSEDDALAAEKLLIIIYGRKDNGTGCLRNLTDGGEGVSNPSQETRNKIGQVHIGNKHFLGRKLSPEHRAKISMARRGKKLSVEHCRKLSESHIGKPSGRAGYVASIGTRHRLHLSHVGKPWSAARRAAQDRRGK